VHTPSVAVEVIAYRPIYVLGEVNKPGQYSYQPVMQSISNTNWLGGSCQAVFGPICQRKIAAVAMRR
jgi:protein involved in polysaccharide export with SLBB domain